MTRQLNALFAERVLGCSLDPDGDCGCESEAHCQWDTCCDRAFGGTLKPYTTDLSAAWEGVERLPSRRFVRIGKTVDGSYFVHLAPVEPHEPEDCPQAMAPHVAHAVVLACLRAVGINEEEIENALH